MRFKMRTTPVRMLPLLLLPLLLAGCTEIMVGSHLAKRAGEAKGCQTEGAPKIGNPYMIDGKRYAPISTSKGFTEEGIASWYGADFHGKPTANGECYNMYAFTAAHKTLPLPTVVRVTNLENNKSVVVKVNDRGPFVGTRVIDLSYAAAQSIGMVGKGTAPVRVEALGGAFHGDGHNAWSRSAKRAIPLGPRDSVAETLPSVVPQVAEEESLQPVSAQNGRVAVVDEELKALGVPSADRHIPPPPKYEDRVATDVAPLRHALVYVQVGAFSDATRAAAEQAKLGGFYKSAHTTETQAAHGRPLSRVRVGPFRNMTDAEDALGKIMNQGWPDARVVIERK